MVDVWWTFRGENASKLPDTTILTDNADKGIWQLELKCPTLEHKGSYACNAQERNESGVVYRREVLLKIYVPVTIELDTNSTAEAIGGKVNLTCLVTSHPIAEVKWLKDGESLNASNGRIESATTEIDAVTFLSSLHLENLERLDNGTYTCQAINEFTNSSADQDILVEEPPEVEFLRDNVTVTDPTTTTLYWHVKYDGNLPVQRFRLERENYGEEPVVAVDHDIPGNITKYTVTSLLPGITYTFRISAQNGAGTSEYDYLNVSMPADVPPKVSWVHVLASTNETLLFGWRRPNHDNGANITHYIVKLHHHNGSLVANKTLDINTPGRNNHMYIFVNLDPGETYTFQVQACNILGCGNWSEPLEGPTSDGMPDPPRNVQITCDHDYDRDTDFICVTWEAPLNARGTILSYNVTLFTNAQYRNENGQEVEEKASKIEIIDAKSTSFEYKTDVLPNTEYTAQMCTINRSGCGPLSNLTENTYCRSLTNVPAVLPQFYMHRKNNSNDCRQLELKLQRVSERNGLILCYKVVIIKLPKGQNLSKLPDNPQSVKLSTHEKVHKNDGHGAYVAEAFTSDDFVSEVVIGDNHQRYCDSNSAPSDKRRHIIQDSLSNKDLREIDLVQDGSLAPSTNYTGYVQVKVQGPNNTILTKTSPYFSPILTVCTVSVGSPPTPTSTESPILVILGVICGIILVFIAFGLALFLIRNKHGPRYLENGERLGLTALILRTIHRNGHLPGSKAGNLSKVPRLGPISSEELPAAFVERHMDSDLLFQTEFEALPDSFKDRTTHASDAPENLSKNRYPDIKAYDQTRVRLPLIDGVAGSDYINANFIEGYKNRKMFICAQGPLDRTVFDFWRMLWEHRVTVVVMLTGIEEHGQVKCAQYWSESCPKEIEKMFVISLVSTKRYSDYIVRRFQVDFTKDGLTEEREILHFHFVLWKDFLAPEQPSWLLRFIKRVNEHYCSDRGPLLVHCSAGVGRTGTFVAIDSLLQQLEEEGRIDVFAHVSTLRHQRNFLVQSLKQYIFVYRALMEHAQFGDTEIEVRHLRDHYELLKEKVGDSDKTGLAIEFEKLSDVIEDPKTCCVGTMDMNVGKNRYDFIIPYDINRVILPPSPSRDHSSYINASFIQGYDRSLSFIITQDPLETTVIEFWRMIKEQSITTLVMLSEIGEGKTKCQSYWPTEEEEKLCDYIKVTFESCEKLPFYTKREFSVINTKSKTNDKHTITQFQFQEWPCSAGTVPDGTLGLVTLIEDVQLNQEKQVGSGPITVHCSGGGDRSSVFVTLSVLIQQLKAEERVDVFQAARYTRSQRHCMLQTLAQYDFLYRGLLEYIVSRNLCDMGDTQL
ncbi:tyrosine-protein phosphatase 69D isoform X1 [Parasteatoda tepidariorum]|uniref:tyrosine-protein phosphatase 69D isoform X1 n=2 Tax=Parasteatoda tepidariorum TaxID=114398 RepID=UPI0039BC67C1